MPLFEAMGTNINYQGGSGCGQHAKLANQIMIAGTLSGVCEALTYARQKAWIFRRSSIPYRPERQEANS